MNFKKILSILAKIIWFTFVLLTLALILISIFKKDWVEIAIEWMKITVNTLWYWNYLIWFSSSLIEAFPVLWWFLPWTNILLIVGWFFGSKDMMSLIYIIIFSCIWAIIWNFIGYFLWLKYWEKFFEKYWIYVWIWKTELKYLDEWLKKWWALWIILWKFHSTTRTFVPFVAGSLKMSLWKFMIYNTIWSIIRSSLTIILWVLFVSYYKTLLEYSWTISIVILILIWLYIYKFKREAFKTYLREKNAEIEEMSKK